MLFLSFFLKKMMFWDFGQPRTCVSRKKDFVSRKKGFCIKKSFLYPTKVSVSQSTTFAERCIPNKAFCTSRKVAPLTSGLPPPQPARPGELCRVGLPAPDKPVPSSSLQFGELHRRWRIWEGRNRRIAGQTPTSYQSPATLSRT